MPTVLRVVRQFQYEYDEVEDTGEVRPATVWLVEFDGPASPVLCRGAVDPTTSVSVPIRFTAHPEDASSYASHIRATPVDDNTRRHFRVIVEYSNVLQLVTAPLGLRNVSWSYQEDGSEPYFIDFNTSGSLTNSDGAPGSPVVDSAGVPFQDFLSRMAGSITCTFTENIKPSDFDAATDIVPFMKAMNSTGFTIPAPSAGGTAITLAAYQARTSGIECDSSSVQTVDGVKFVQYKATFKIRKSWLDVVDSRGFYEKTSAPGGVSPIAKLQPATAQTARGWPLDSSGHAAATISTAPAQLTFYPYKPVDFSPIVAPTYS